MTAAADGPSVLRGFLGHRVVVFLGSTRNRNSVQARGIPSDSAAATVAFASPEGSRGLLKPRR